MTKKRMSRFTECRCRLIYVIFSCLVPTRHTCNTYSIVKPSLVKQHSMYKLLQKRTSHVVATVVLVHSVILNENKQLMMFDMTTATVRLIPCTASSCWREYASVMNGWQCCTTNQRCFTAMHPEPANHVQRRVVSWSNAPGTGNTLQEGTRGGGAGEGEMRGSFTVG